MQISDSKRSRRILIAALTAALAAGLENPSRAWAEGSDDMGPVVHAGASIAATDCTPGLGICQGLRNTTVLRVDVLFGDEIFVWTGRGNVAVTSPTGDPVNGADGDNLYDSGELVTPIPGVTGAYTVRPAEHQYTCPSGDLCSTNNTIDTFYRWDVTLFAGGVPRPGRVWSRFWSFNARNFGANQATTASFHALSDGGFPDTDAVIELRVDGLAGFLYDVFANRTGPVSADLSSHGRSLPQGPEVTITPEFPVYLNVPEVARFGRATDADIQISDVGCTAEESGGTGAIARTFSFETNVTGTAQIVCDLDDPPDGASLTDNDDLVLIAPVAPGPNAVSWDGRDNDGTPALLDSYACIVRVTVGEFHYVASDIETSFPGLRLFEIEADLDERPLRMFWNDSAVQSGGAVMANGETSPETSPADGLLSASGAAVPFSVENPDGNARAWGNFSVIGTKGDAAFLDTFTWLASVEVAETVTCAVPNDNPPTVTAPPDVTVEATGALTSVALGTATAEDPEDGPLIPTPDTTGPFPLGATQVTWSATDADGNNGAAVQLVTVVDSTPPEVIAPPDVTAVSTGPMTEVDLHPELASTSDLVDGTLTPTPDTTGPFPLGVTLVTWSVTDASGNTGSAVQRVEILAPSDPCAGPWSYVGPNPFELPNSGEATELAYVQAHVSPVLVGPIRTGLETTTWTSNGDYAVILVKSAQNYWLHVNVTTGQMLPSSSSTGRGGLQDISHVSGFVCAQ